MHLYSRTSGIYDLTQGGLSGESPQGTILYWEGRQITEVNTTWLAGATLAMDRMTTRVIRLYQESDLRERDVRGGSQITVSLVGRYISKYRIIEALF